MPPLDINSLEKIFSAQGIHSFSHITMVDADELAVLYVPDFPPSSPSIILNIATLEIASGVVRVLRAVYPSSHPIRVISNAGSGVFIEEATLAELEDLPADKLPLAIYVPALPASYSFEAFQNIIARLRAPGGCPWDQKQTHQSMRSDLLEETYEVLAALDANNPLAMREEVGDLLLHIVMQAQIGMDNGEFSMADVLHGIYTKIVRRHPHVFGELEVEAEQDILANWEQMKAQERLENGQTEAGLLDSLNLALPGLVQAQQFQARAARVRFDWPDITGVLAKVFEEIEEVQLAEDEAQQHAEIGDLLFAVVNLARWYKVDAESALRQANQRFRERFKYIEHAARTQNKRVSDLSLDEMDQLWEAAKRKKNE